jgi:thymidylate kinase
MKRITKRGETLGTYETVALLREKRKKYKEVLKNIPHVSVKASDTIQSVQTNILKYINPLI